jgi:hypothetical protein
MTERQEVTSFGKYLKHLDEAISRPSSTSSSHRTIQSQRSEDTAEINSTGKPTNSPVVLTFKARDGKKRACSYGGEKRWYNSAQWRCSGPRTRINRLVNRLWTT